MILFFFWIGLAVGSFLNVLIDRLPKGESVVHGRSYCDSCKKKIAWYDLIPLLSFIMLKRRCRYCRKLISWQYPLVEILTGFTFVATYYLVMDTLYRINYFPTLLLLLTIFSGLIVIFFADLKYMIIPDQVVFILLGIALLYILLLQPDVIVLNFAIGFLFALLFLFLVLITKGKGMGVGDVKLTFFMGLFLGFPKIIVAFYLSFLTGALVSLILVIGRIKKLKSTVPFGPFLIAATVIAYVWGDGIWMKALKYLGI